MLKRLCIAGAVLLLLLGVGVALLYWFNAPPEGGGIQEGEPPAPLPAVEQSRPLPVGEELVYNLMWKGFSAGTTTFSVLEAVELNGRPGYHLRMATKSGSMLDSVYAIRDSIESVVDRRTGASLRFSRDVREGTFKVYRAKDTLDFDYDKKVAVYRKTKFRKEGDSIKEYPPRPIPGPLQDTLSLLYYFRNSPIRKGAPQTFLIGTRKRETELIVSVAEEKRLTLPGLGSFDALRLKLDPKAVAGQKEKVKIFLSKGEVELWVERSTCIPLQLRVSGIPLLGSADAVLHSVKGGPLAQRRKP
ncbi:MAG: DUF3108 domain-containing protein [Planctomycetota bacterium]